jgi:hypothetical protein
MAKRGTSKYRRFKKVGKGQISEFRLFVRRLIFGGSCSEPVSE